MYDQILMIKAFILVLNWVDVNDDGIFQAWDCWRSDRSGKQSRKV